MKVSGYLFRLAIAVPATMALTSCFSWWYNPSDGSGGGSEPVAVADTLYPSKDAHVDPEDKDVGLGSEFRLMYANAVGLLAFEGVAEALAGKTLVGAELHLNGWTNTEWSPGTGGSLCTLQVFSAASDWKEGTGHWYWHENSPHNNYAFVYSLFPQYTPPANATDPIEHTGISWSTSDSLRSGMVRIGYGTGLIPASTSGKYPLLGSTGRIVADLTEKLPSLAAKGKPLGLAVRLAPRATPGGWAWIYSKDHVSKAYAPKLVLRMKTKK